MVSGAQLIELEEADIVLTGGIESMSQAPHVMRGLRSGLRLGQGKLKDYLDEALLDPDRGLFMAQTAGEVRGQNEITRRRRTHSRCAASNRGTRLGGCRLKDEIVPVEIRRAKG